MATIRKADRMGWRPGCLVLSDDSTSTPNPDGYGDWAIPVPTTHSGGWRTALFNIRQVHAFVTLADVTIAKACVRMPD